MFNVVISNKAKKQLDTLQNKISEKISNSILQLEGNPFPPQYKKLINRTGYRIRIGDYRILYDIDLKSNEIQIISIDHRKDVYR